VTCRCAPVAAWPVDTWPVAAHLSPRDLSPREHRKPCACCRRPAAPT